MKPIVLILSLLISQISFASLLSNEQNLLLDECSVLLEEIKKSDCGGKTLDFLKNAYLKIGVNISQRTMSFENKETLNPAFTMKGEWSPSPVLTLSLGDNYFENSNFGYQLGLTYFSDIAFEQEIERDSITQTADLLTYSKMTVVAFTPSIFYSAGRNDATPESFFTFGIGFNAGYSKVKGTAHITELESDTACYNTGSQYLYGNASEEDIMANCSFGTYESDGMSYGGSVYFGYEYHNWVTELNGGVYIQDIDGDYTFSTFDLSLSVSRKFGF